MAATVRTAVVTGASPTLANSETGVGFGLTEDQDSLVAVTSPTTAGTVYTYPKSFCLEVTATDTTDLSNRRIKLGGALPTGIIMAFRDDGTTYVRGNSAPAANTTTDGAVPAGYTLLTTSNQVYDASAIAAGAGRNGDYISVIVGVSSTYTAGSLEDFVLPDIILTYDEA